MLSASQLSVWACIVPAFWSGPVQPSTFMDGLGARNPSGTYMAPMLFLRCPEADGGEEAHYLPIIDARQILGREPGPSVRHAHDEFSVPVMRFDLNLSYCAECAQGRSELNCRPRGGTGFDRV